MEPAPPDGGLAMASVMLREEVQASWNGLEVDTRPGASGVSVAHNPVRAAVVEVSGEGRLSYLGVHKLVGTELSGTLLDAGIATVESESGETQTRPLLSMESRGSRELGTSASSWRASGVAQANVLPGASDNGLGPSRLRVAANGELERWDNAAVGERLQASATWRGDRLMFTGAAASVRGEYALHKAPQVPRDLVVSAEAGWVARSEPAGALRTGIAARVDLRGRLKQTFVTLETNVHGEIHGAPMGFRAEVEQKLDGRRSIVGGYDSGGARSRDPFDVRADAPVKPRGAFVGLKWKW